MIIHGWGCHTRLGAMEEGTRTEIRFDVGENDLIEWYRCAVLQHRGERFRRKAVLVLIVIAAMGCMVPSLVQGVPLAPFHYAVMVVAAALLVGLPIWWRAAPARTVRLYLSQTKGVVGECFVRLDKRGIAWQGPLSRAWLDWELVNDISHDADYVTIWMGREHPIVIPRRGAFESSQELQRFADLARRMRSAAPSYERNCPRCKYDLRGTETVGCPECGWQRGSG